MRSLTLAVVVLAGVLAYTSAFPQFNRKDLAFLETLLAEAAKINSTIRFGNNTIITSGIANAVANSNDGTIRPTPPENQSGNNNKNYNYNYRYPYFYGGYWRKVDSPNGEIVEDLDISQGESYEESHELSDPESGEDIWSEEDESEGNDDEEDDDEDDDEENTDEQGDESQEEADEQPDLLEEAADLELDALEKELIEQTTN